METMLSKYCANSLLLDFSNPVRTGAFNVTWRWAKSLSQVPGDSEKDKDGIITHRRVYYLHFFNCSWSYLLAKSWCRLLEDIIFLCLFICSKAFCSSDSAFQFKSFPTWNHYMKTRLSFWHFKDDHNSRSHARQNCSLKMRFNQRKKK